MAGQNTEEMQRTPAASGAPVALGAPPMTITLARAHSGGWGFRLLRAVYTVLPILFGVDKFSHLLVDWNRYLAPVIRRQAPGGVNTFMDAVGVVEILAGLLVAFRPQYGGFIVAALLFANVINLLLIPGYFDIAARDLALSLGALSLGLLARERTRRRATV